MVRYLWLAQGFDPPCSKTVIFSHEKDLTWLSGSTQRNLVPFLQPWPYITFRGCAPLIEQTRVYVFFWAVETNVSHTSVSKQSKEPVLIECLAVTQSYDQYMSRHKRTSFEKCLFQRYAPVISDDNPRSHPCFNRGFPSHPCLISVD